MFDSNPDQEHPNPKKSGLFSRLKQRLAKTRDGLGFSSLLSDTPPGPDLIEEIETRLLLSDAGVEVTEQVIGQLNDKLSRKQVNDSEAVHTMLRENLIDIVKPCATPLQIDSSHRPFILLMVGVNGAGKTTTIGKLARRFQAQGKSVMLAAGDTFRAAAKEQLEQWGEKHGLPVFTQSQGNDSAALIHDAIQSAQSNHIDILIADTAGRLHTQKNLMSELQKVQRVIKKIDPSAPHEVMLVLDAGNGQNALRQAEKFHEALGVTGITLTKLDGTAKGGIILAVASQLKLPIRFIGIGEQTEDLREFNAEDFIKALLD